MSPMAGFMIRFLISNLFLCGITALLFLCRRLFQNILTGPMQYRLWYVMLGLLSVPFLPFPAADFSRIFLWINGLKEAVSSQTGIFTGTPAKAAALPALDAIQDFALSADTGAFPLIGALLWGIWLTGIWAMIFLLIQSKRRFGRVKASALPLQNKEALTLYRACLEEMKITADIPVYSTAFLKSPVIAGLFRPAVYLPIRVISDCSAYELRYILLHELQHFRHKDALTGCLMDLAGILYWFNPLVWYILREMRSDRELACDTAVLELLGESDRQNYGYTLLRLAEKRSLTAFPSALGIGGNQKQMQKRIRNIASYRIPSVRKKIKGALSFCLITALLAGLSPLLSTYAADRNHYKWDTTSEIVSAVDLSSYFHGYRGSFVLYDLEADIWHIYDMEKATTRVSPDSTYKIYDALFGLEEQCITPEDSFRTWDGTVYPFEAWNRDQDLYTAMHASVNWYFQGIDTRLGKSAVRRYIREIGYGNEEIFSDFSSYWMESSLKISPVEQVELLTGLYQNRFNFAPENIEAVKESLCLASSENGTFYGKTGTGRIDGRDRNGWFIGFIETDSNTWFFAANIQSDTDASGSKAAEITMSILSDKKLWEPHASALPAVHRTPR